MKEGAVKERYPRRSEARDEAPSDSATHDMTFRSHRFVALVVAVLASGCGFSAYDLLGTRDDAGSAPDAGSSDGGDPDGGSGCDCTVTKPSVCGEGDVVLTYVASGICRGGACVYAEIETTCANGCDDGRCIGCVPSCEERACGSDGCGGSCGACTEVPAAACIDGTKLRTYAAGGTCIDGACRYESTDTTCANGCAAGACLDCTPACGDHECGNDGCGGSCGACTTPPGQRCIDATTLGTFGGGGCNDGTCVYGVLDETTCPFGCRNDACCTPDCTGRKCGDDGCGGSCGTCEEPPSAQCLTGTTLSTPAAIGSCNLGVCNYPPATTECVFGCANGACSACVASCTGKRCGDDGCGHSCGSCDTPAPACTSSRTFTTYSAATCSATFTCTWSETTAICDEPANAIAACVTGCTQNCLTGYALTNGRCLATSNVGLQDASPWPMEGGGPHRQGRSPFNGPQTNGRRWEYLALAAGGSSPVVGSDGTAYYCLGHRLLAVSGGGLQWDYSPTADETTSSSGSPVLGAAGVIFYGLADKLIAYHRSQSTSRWTYTLGGAASGSPAVAPDGTVYIVGADRFLYALAPGGTLRWKFELGAVTAATPTLGLDGTIYVRSPARGNPASSVLYAVTPQGGEKWMYPTDATGTDEGHPTAGTDGTVYLVSRREKKIHAITSQGTRRWTFTAGGDTSSPVAIGRDGTLYFGARDGKLYAVDRSGTQRWTYQVGSIVRGQPLVGSDGTIYFGTEDGKLHAVTAGGVQRWTYTASDAIYTAPSLGSDGTAYFTTINGALYAIGP